MSKDKLMRASIGAIDEDGEFCTVYAGTCTRARAAEIMQDILDEDGLPILEIFGKHEKLGDDLHRTKMVKVTKAETIQTDQVARIMEHIKPDPTQLIVHAEFNRNGLRYAMTGPADWVQEQINKAAQEK